MNQPGALFRLLCGMPADANQGVDHMIEGVEVVVEHNQVSEVGFLFEEFNLLQSLYLRFAAVHHASHQLQ